MIDADVRDLLPLHALGVLDDDERARVDAAVAADPALAAELAALSATTAALPGALAPVEPSPSLRARLLDSAARAAGRFERFAARFAHLFDVTLDRARSLLAKIDDATAWEPGPGPGSWLIHFEPAPSLAGADTGFVRLAPGATFTWHRHAGPEHSLVLAGRATDSLAGTLAPGDEAHAGAHSEHDFTTVGDEDFVFAVWVFGVDFDVPKPS